MDWNLLMNLRQKQDLALSKKMKSFLEECNSKLLFALENRDLSDNYKREITTLVNRNKQQIKYLSEDIKSAT